MTIATTTTTATPATEVETSTPSDKLLEYLIREHTSETNSPEENLKALAKAAWEHANTDTRKRIPAAELVQNKLEADAVFAKRIAEVKQVMRNTLRKMTHGAPAGLKALANNQSAYIGIYQTRNRFGRLETTNISSRIANGQELNDNDEITFSANFWNADHGKLMTQNVSFPARLLKNDPMAIAQYVRTECRNFVEENARKEKRQLADEKSALIKEQKDLEQKLARIAERQEKPVKTIKPRTKDKPKRVARPAEVVAS